MAEARDLAHLAQGQVGLVLKRAQDAAVGFVKLHATLFATVLRCSIIYSNMLPQVALTMIHCSRRAGNRAEIGDPVSALLS